MLKNNYIYNHVKKYTYKPPNKHYYYGITIFVAFIQINKHKAKIYNQCTYTKIIIKMFYSSNIKKVCVGKHKNDKSIIRQAKTNSTK